jgi:hypothetical protein
VVLRHSVMQAFRAQKRQVTSQATGMPTTEAQFAGLDSSGKFEL